MVQDAVLALSAGGAAVAGTQHLGVWAGAGTRAGRLAQVILWKRWWHYLVGTQVCHHVGQLVGRWRATVRTKSFFTHCRIIYHPWLVPNHCLLLISDSVFRVNWKRIIPYVAGKVKPKKPRSSRPHFPLGWDSKTPGDLSQTRVGETILQSKVFSQDTVYLNRNKQRQ